ncbi:RHS repeat domain-containing protein [Nonomuraea sediminis]|uniref:RHS repeat domain-containing protein n=1 Tax=Nonomuraea sediminis TaxID=2835864 RepID=UPI001BDBCC1E|nr:RHS repeat-associated core domain-containing protein [Nonomuraea sediminis]
MFDYSPFRDAYGGGWAERLRLVRLPDCALTTPDLPKCQGTPVPTRNDPKTGTLTANLSEGLYAAQATPTGPSGSFAVTPLSASSTWSGGGSSGDFDWNYPLNAPAVPGGLTPNLGFSYSSQSVDGRTAATNNQPSWIGEGFALEPGAIERRYKSCGDDLGGNNGQTKYGDQCWGTDNATLSLNGSGGELIPVDAAGTSWRLKNDNGTQVKRLTGAANGDDNGEHWLVTSPDGTRYYFGAKPAAKSVYTVPVYGNNAGEPCNKAAFADSWCTQAYRWNLDYVADRHGNAMAYFYDPETNYYARGGLTSAGTQYVRGGQLNRIEYGLRDGATGTAPAKVTFETADRCRPGATCWGSDGKAVASNWDDTPWDQSCAAGACTLTSPSFWTARRLARVVTQVRNGTAYDPVDSWTLRQSYPDNGDTTRAGLWLDGITHTGHVGGTLSMPEVVFEGQQLANRADTSNGPAMNWWRIKAIRSEFGGTTTITYSDRDCGPGNMPSAPETNTKRCQPSLYERDGTMKLEYFHKYVVAKVVQNANLPGDPSTPVVTSYEYVGAPAWHYDVEDGLIPASRKTWGQWRGYGKVRAIGGDPAEGAQSLTETVYFRGMDGDKLPSGKRVVTVTDSAGTAVPDQPHLAGQVRETITYNGVGGPAISGTINDMWVSAPTATRVRDWGTDEARMTGVAATKVRTAKADGTWRRTTTETTYDAYGLPAQVNDLGDASLNDDDRCTRTTYARNLDAWIVNLPSRSETVSVACAEAPSRPADLLSDVKTTYDDGLVHGDVTKVEQLSGTGAYVTASRAIYDSYGRPTTTWDIKGNATTLEYVTGASGLVTALKTTNPLKQTTVGEFDSRGDTSAQIDVNGKRTDLENDPLGRHRKVWAPGRTKGVDGPNAEFTYLLRTGSPNAVTTRELQADGSYLAGYALFDGLGRSRQAQKASPAGGRTITDTVFDSRGQIVKNNQPYWNSAPPGTELTVAADANVPGQTRTTFDGAGRAVAEAFYKLGVNQWAKLTTPSADKVSVDPPTGSTATTTVTNARGWVTELDQYQGGAPTGPADVTRYGYDKAGNLTSVTDPSGNVWRYTYDLAGRKTGSADPDRGTTTYAYNDANELVSSKDAEGRELFYAYDELGRKTALRDGSATGTLRASWTFDTVAKGQPASATRYVNGAAYTTAITGYDDGYRATGSTLTIPPTEGKLAGTYPVSSTYALTGRLATTTLPAAGGLPEETLTYGYDALDNQVTLTANGTNYVGNTKYTAYGEIGQITLGTPGKQVWLTNEYEDGTRRLIRAVTDREMSGKRQADVTYGYDETGNITRVADQPSSYTGVPADYQCFTTDYLRRITEAWTPSGGTCGTPANSGIGGPAPYWSSYTFDKSGNRTAETRHATTGDTVLTLAYPASAGSGPHRVSSVSTKKPDGSTALDSYAYDKAGNTISRGAQSLAWDPESRLAAVTEGGKKTEFVYSADGERLLRRDPAGTTLYVAGMEFRLSGDTVTGTRYYTHAGITVAGRTGASVTWISSDHHGTGQLAIKADTLDVVRRRATPFGVERGGPAAWPDERGFLGGDRDPSTGLTHLGAREYEPTTGRFISADPVINTRDPQQMNGYAYAGNNPLVWSDPSGLVPLDPDTGRPINEHHDGQKGTPWTGVQPRKPICSGGYCIGSPRVPKLKSMDDDFPRDPKQRPTKDDRFLSSKFHFMLAGCTFLNGAGASYDGKCGDWDDGIAGFSHYLNGNGEDFAFDLEEAYREDEKIRAGIDAEIERVVANAGILAALSGSDSFEITGENHRQAGASTKNWVAALNSYNLWSSAEVQAVDGKITMMTITLHGVDRYNFNHNMGFEGIPDEKGGRLSTVGLAHNFTQTGTMTRTITWVPAPGAGAR